MIFNVKQGVKIDPALFKVDYKRNTNSTRPNRDSSSAMFGAAVTGCRRPLRSLSSRCAAGRFPARFPPDLAMPFSIATWNINSVRLRMPLVERLPAEQAPDVLCLQETKCPDDLFPFARLRAGSATSTSRSTARRAITAWRPSRGGRSRSSKSAGSATSTTAGTSRCAFRPAASRSCCTISTCPAGGDEPDPEINPKFRHKLDFVAEMNAMPRRA